MTPSNTSWLEPKPANPIRRNLMMTPELSCGIPADCSLLKLFGPDSVCTNSDTVVYSVKRNPGCTVPVLWRVDTAAIRVLQISDTSVFIWFERAGVTKIYAELTTPCGIFSIPSW
jgi:hypothetical protein